jgi:hypothetical protein
LTQGEDWDNRAAMLRLVVISIIAFTLSYAGANACEDSLVALNLEKLPETPEVQVIEVLENSNGAEFAKAKFNEDKSDPFVTGLIRESLENEFGLLRTLGFEFDGNELIYPLPTRLNENIKKFNKSYAVLNPISLRFVFVDKTEVPIRTFASYFAKAQIPLSTKGQHHFHDFFVHVPGYLALPFRLVDTLGGIIDAHKALLDQPLSRDFQRDIRALLESWIEYLDFMTAELWSDFLSSTEYSEVARALTIEKLMISLNINEVFELETSGKIILNKLLARPLSDKDRLAVESVLKEKRGDYRYDMKVSTKNLRNLAEETYRRLRREYLP